MLLKKPSKLPKTKLKLLRLLPQHQKQRQPSLLTKQPPGKKNPTLSGFFMPFKTCACQNPCNVDLNINNNAQHTSGSNQRFLIDLRHGCFCRGKHHNFEHIGMEFPTIKYQHNTCTRRHE